MGTVNAAFARLTSTRVVVGKQLKKKMRGILLGKGRPTLSHSQHRFKSCSVIHFLVRVDMPE